MANVDFTKAEAEVVKARDKWVKDNLTKLPQKITKMLDEHFDKMVASIIGLKYSTWDGWEIDRVNGRRSILSEEIQDQMRDKIREYVKDNLKNFKLNVKQKQAIRKHATDDLYSHLYHLGEIWAQEQAQAIFNKIMEDQGDNIELTFYYVGNTKSEALAGLPFDDYSSAESYRSDNDYQNIYSVVAKVDTTSMEVANV